MIQPKQPLAQSIIQLCNNHNIQHIVISPGSRNAPLTIGFTNHDFFDCYSIVDERSAGFFALGIAQQLQQPVALVCTSGSALVNYFPAVTEAFYSRIPLVVISADRPEHLVNIGDGQTITQPHIFGAHVLYEANLEMAFKKSFLKAIKSNNSLIEKALHIANSQNGPVHINVPFPEPLYDTIEVEEQQSKPDRIKLKSNTFSLSKSDHKKWNSSKRKMILVGVNPPHSVQETYLKLLAEDPSIIVLTETTSNLHHPDFFPSIDQLISPLDSTDFETLQPDLLLTFGGMIVSKKIKTFLRTNPPKTHWHIDPVSANDTFFSLTKHFKCDVNTFFDALSSFDATPIVSTYFETWNHVKVRRQQKHKKYLKSIPFSDFMAFDKLLKHIPDNYMLQSGNSSTIRYLQLFDLNKTLTVFCNRGTSGIDGSTSTAIGAATVSENPTVFITGDLSFFYDSNALWNNYTPSNFRIIIINNRGGGIFRILPGNKNSKNFSTFFETNHDLTAEPVSKLFNFEYTSASSNEELETALENFYIQSSRPKLLEIFTPSSENDQILLSYFDFIK
ncbi:MAG: 2-succinyl-5-enolpyruvyl-6-hydroxy-3-cyclohexene-1-carboxylic-acid synthase [Flavobacteriaceae bacterium]|jgi:2-succinyl-5-enolpyruvyl-6-hydroxy-3-cyclohexene-1-carboxylate synthase|nr:2-succinyl-5-enolpyruvyl-6-hydroxy-3-cyclohexene-1-carboxylic-acid synthase [Flavobacteriaceae bacterium]